MSDPNILVSNGTCYTAPGQTLGGGFIPCGNDAFGRQTCCGAGDNCIADNACFGIHGSGYGSYLTYWAGCSDPEYKDATCPKKDVDQPWVALTLCDNSNGEWAICSQEGNPSTLRPGSYCSCTVASSATVAFSDSTSLTNICSLPQSTGQSIQFFAGHTPSGSPTPGSAAPTQSSGSTTADGGSSGASRSATATSGRTSTKASSGSGKASVTVFTSSGRAVTSSIAPSTTASSGGAGAGNSNTSGGTASALSVAAKAGISVGAAVVLLAIIAALLLLRRRRQKRVPSEIESGSDHDNDNGAKPPEADAPPKSNAPSNAETPEKPDVAEKPPVSAASTAPMWVAEGQTFSEADGQPVLEADGRAARPWTLRSELEGSKVEANRAEQAGVAPDGRVLSTIAELPGSENFAGEQGAGSTLAQEAHRQLGPAWRG